MNANATSPAVERDSLWTSVLESLRGKLSARRLEELRRDTRLIEHASSTLRVAARLDTLRTWITDGRLSLLDATVSAITDDGVELAMLPSAGEPPSSDPRIRLDAFIASPANGQGLACARALAEQRYTGTHPTLLFGPPGSGKSHLLKGVTHDLRRAGVEVLCVNAHDLSLALVSAMREKKLQRFREPMQRAQVLLIDEADGLAGREATQNELALIVRERATARAPLVLASRGSSDAIADLQPALHARLAHGQVVNLRPLEWETRVGIILDRLAFWQVETAPDVASYLAGALGSDLGRVDAVLTRLMTHPACSAGLSDPELVRRVLENGGPRVAGARPQEVIRLVSDHFSVRPGELRSSARSPRVTTPRQLAMYLLRHHCGLSYPEIGQRFRRHHTTAMHACKRVESQRERNSSLGATVLLLEKELLRLSEDSA